MVLPLSLERVTRWSALDRFAWGSLHSHGVLDGAEGEALRAAPHGIDLERVGLWPTAEFESGGEASHPDVEILERACERAIARHRGRGERVGLFLDRDGTLVREVGYLSDPGDLELLPGVDVALRRAADAGLALVVISNQAGVGRGLFPLERVYEAMARLRELLRERGVELDAIHFCPHRPGEGCVCRKPAPGLLERAAQDLQLRLSASVMVGDKRLDPATGHAAGARGVLVRTGYGREEEQVLGSDGFESPDRVFDDLPAAITWWLDEGRALGPRSAERR
ncbi:MAG: HAD family hydrolase [Candidatus Eisenbacteria bacterium]|uniref:D,D-heptose 1,7-bisphosphate phosphatase n=1 Tax=Eiseniibacteriota bacterium TaxID=2212470 RepID=A0A849SSI5_UNCEI|nr:HAD family hydrolase [Candidatus Eisenbacteria bacterium]